MEEGGGGGEEGGGAVREFCSELLGCGSDTSRHRESSVPHLRGRGAGKRWHRGVMKKCLCVRGLKNSPFRVVRLLAEQRRGPVSEICCKDYLVWILYQGTAKQEPLLFFWSLDLAVATVFLERTLPFLLHSLQWAHVSRPFLSPSIHLQIRARKQHQLLLLFATNNKKKWPKLNPDLSKVFAGFISITCIQNRVSAAQDSGYNRCPVWPREKQLCYSI